MKDQNYVVYGFKFETKDEFYKAQKEAETVEYLRAKTDLTDIKVVAKLYSGLINKNSFQTLVGYCFLNELRDIIIKSKAAPVEKIPIIPIITPQSSSTVETAEELVKDRMKQENHKLSEEIENYILRLKRTKIIIGFLAVIIIGMFVITLTSDNSPFKNTEDRIVDNYAGWQQQLDQQDQELRERARAIEKREKAVEAKENELGIESTAEDLPSE